MYYVAGVLLALGLVFSAYQLWWHRKDTNIRNQRAAAEKAIEYASRYLGDYVSLDAKFLDQCSAQKFQSYEGPIGSFCSSALEQKYKKNAVTKFRLVSCLSAMNELLAISSAFTSGVACEEVGFKIIGRTFCGTVAFRYDTLCIARQQATCDYYQPIIDLYQIWAARLTVSELNVARKSLEDQMSTIATGSIPPIGTSK